MVDAKDAELMALLKAKKDSGRELTQSQQQLLEIYAQDFPVTNESPFANVLDEVSSRALLGLMNTSPKAAKGFLTKKFGADNVMEENGVLFARPKGSDDFFAVNPKGPQLTKELREKGVAGAALTPTIAFDIVNNPDTLGDIAQAAPGVARFLSIIAGSVGGTALGSQAGMPLRGGATGAALGSAAGDLVGTGTALATGSISPEEAGGDLPGIIAKATTVGGLEFILPFGFQTVAKTPAAKKAVTGALKEAGVAGNEIAKFFKDIGKAYAKVSAGNKLERLGFGGTEMTTLKAAVKERTFLDKQLARLQDYIPSISDDTGKALTSLGKTAQKGVKLEVDNISAKAKGLFRAADRIVDKKAKTGTLKADDFADVSLFVRQLDQELADLAENSIVPTDRQAARVLSGVSDTVKKILNGTVRNAPNATKQKLGMTTFTGTPPKRDYLGVLRQESTLEPVIESGFNPKLVTAKDLRTAKNYFSTMLDDLGSFQNIPTSALKKVLTRYKGQIDDALSPGIDLQDTLGGVLTGSADEGLETGVQYTKGLIKAPNSQTFKTYNQGYKTLADGFKQTPNAVREAVVSKPNELGILEPVNPSSAQKNLLNLDLENARAVRKAVDKYVTGAEKLSFRRGVQGQFFEKGARSDTLAKVKPTAKATKLADFVSEDEMLEAQAAGISLDRGALKEATTQPSDAGLVEQVSAASMDKLGNKSLALQGLLSPDEQLAQSQIKDTLALAQARQGMEPNIQNMVQAKPLARTLAGTVGGSPASLGVGAALDAVAGFGRGIAGAAAPAAKALESIPAAALADAGIDTVFGEGLESPTNEQARKFRLRIQKGRLLD